MLDHLNLEEIVKPAFQHETCSAGKIPEERGKPQAITMEPPTMDNRAQLCLLHCQVSDHVLAHKHHRDAAVPHELLPQQVLREVCMPRQD